MTSLHDLTLRGKLTAIILITCSAAVLVACSIFALYDVTTFQRSLADELETIAKITGSNMTAALTFADSKSANEILSTVGIQPHIEEACVYKADGTVLAEFRRNGSKESFTPPAPRPDESSIVSGHMLVFRQISLDGEVIGSIYVKSDLGELYARIGLISAIILIAFLLSLVISFLIASRLQLLISEPIDQLTQAASQVSMTKDYSLRVAKGSHDEIGFLMDRFNEMLQQIQLRESALQHAHDGLELRVRERTRELQEEVAERTRTEQELAERKQFLNSLIENIPLAIVAVGYEGDVQMCNRAFEILFRYSQQAILGRQLSELVTSADTRPEHEANRLILMSGQPVHSVARRTRSDGSVVDVEFQSVPLRRIGKRTGALLLYQDVTQRKLAEEAMRRAREAAEAASQAKSEFLANMSHEIRTPMNGILGMTELTLETDLNSEQREYLGMVKTSADSLLGLLNDILDFSKIEAGKLDLESVEFPLRQSLGETLKTLGLRAHEKGLELAWRVGFDIPERLVGDLGRLRQVVVNLVGNAVKFTERGEVLLQAEKLQATSESVELHFSVRDTGIGISKDKQGAIFEPFTQADGSTTRLYGGTGLGLGIATQLVKLMNGKIWVESESGQGSTFHFTCHFGIAEPTPADLSSTGPELLRDRSVLIVDDNRTNRIILVEMLGQWGMRPEAADGAHAAMAVLEKARLSGHPFDLVITDLQMPGVDGFGLVEQVRRIPDSRPMRFLIISSSAQRSDRIRSRELQITSYLTKPVQPSELLDAVLTELSRLPLQQQQPSSAPEQNAAKGPCRKILLAEDNPVNRLLAKRMLEKDGHTVVIAENGREALAAIEQEGMDLVLMGVQMPVMDGLEAIRVIRAKEKTAGGHLPIIALTAHAMTGDRERCMAAGADDYLTKPIRAPELLASMARLHCGENADPPHLGLESHLGKVPL